jgi:hypothetical protein
MMRVSVLREAWLQEMFNCKISLKKNNVKDEIINVFLDIHTYNKFKSFVSTNNLDEASAFVKVLERGMDNYWLEVFKQLKDDYHLMKNIYKDYNKDNEILKLLEKQNDYLKKILTEYETKNTLRKSSETQ